MIAGQGEVPADNKAIPTAIERAMLSFRAVAKIVRASIGVKVRSLARREVRQQTNGFL